MLCRPNLLWALPGLHGILASRGSAAPLAHLMAAPPPPPRAPPTSLLNSTTTTSMAMVHTCAASLASSADDSLPTTTPGAGGQCLKWWAGHRLTEPDGQRNSHGLQVVSKAPKTRLHCTPKLQTSFKSAGQQGSWGAGSAASLTQQLCQG